MKTILHFLSVVRWDQLDADSNFEVFLKTVNWLAECHHYVLTPWRVFAEMSAFLSDVSYTLLPYEYPGNILAGRHEFRSAEFARSVNLRKMDIDFLFCHQPELLGNIMAALSAKRAGNALISFVFFHWIDCPASRGSRQSVSVCHRQAEAIDLTDRFFVHGTTEGNYLTAIDRNRHKAALMPLSSAPLPESRQPKDWKDVGQYVVFNHRKTQSTGWKQFENYLQDSGLNICYTRSNRFCEDHGIMSARNGEQPFSRPEYRYVLEHAVCAVCMISGYATWNLSIQDPVRLGVPLLCREHQAMRRILGDHPGVYWFHDKASFQEALETCRADGVSGKTAPLEDFNANFQDNLLTIMQAEWAKKESNRRGGSKHTVRWKEEITRVPGISKAAIIRRVHGPTASAHASWQFVRRDLLRDVEIESTIVNGETRYRAKNDQAATANSTRASTSNH